MNRLASIFLAALLSVGFMTDIQAQGRPGGTNGRASSRTSVQRGATPSRQQATRPQQATQARPGGRPATSARPATSTRPGASARPTEARPQTRPATQGRPGASARPSTPTRPGASARPTEARPQTRPSTQGRPGGSRPEGVRPGGDHRPGGGNYRPEGTRPGGSRPEGVRPGGDYRPDRPHRHGGGMGPGSSVPRPGGWNPVRPPHNNWSRPSYRPPRPGGGYWGPPAPYPYRIGFWAPPVPPRYTVAYVGAPTLGTILGLTFGSFIDTGINALFNAGYNVAGYTNNVIYLTNVNQLGMMWPEVAMNYTDGLLTNSQFSYYSGVPGLGRFNALYAQLCGMYGAPVANTGNTVTWWAGGNTGYITLHYSYSNSLSGLPGYYTTLTYSAYY